MLNKIYLKVTENIYIIFPIICIFLWALAFLIQTTYRSEFYGFLYFDFKIYYGSGKMVLDNPKNLYTHDYEYDIGYFYLPFFATLFSISFSLLPYEIAYFLFYFVNLLSAIIFIVEYNKVLILFDVKKKFHRFFFLMIISNGFLIFNVFIQNQVKFIIALSIFFILKREIQYQKLELQKNVKYYIINLGIFVFILSMAPYLILLLLIYLFQDIRLNNLFKLKSLKIYGITIGWFLVQNILFIIYPSLILDFLAGTSFFYRIDYLWLFYLSEWITPSTLQLIYLTYITTVIIIFLTLYLILKKDLSISEKFSYFALSAIIFALFGGRILVILLPLTILLFIPHLKQDEKGIEFLKKNYILLIGLMAVIGIYINVNPDTIYIFIVSLIPVLNNEILWIIIYIRWIILLCVMIISLLLLKLIKNYPHLKHFK